jgi:adenylosuccinate lyase
LRDEGGVKIAFPHSIRQCYDYWSELFRNGFRITAMTDYESYLSPFTWRYGSAEMRSIWSEAQKRRLWRSLWVALAKVQSDFGLLTAQQVAELQEHADDVDVDRSLQIEAEIHHDLMAELKAFAEQCPLAGGALHLGATSTDIEDNADVLRMRQSLDLIIVQLSRLLESITEKIELYADAPLIAFTHLQPAEPSTLGYRLAMYAQDLLMDWDNVRRARRQLRGKGFNGAVGTRAAYADLLGVDRLAEFETRLSVHLELPFFEITSQTYPRKQDYQVVSALAGLGASVYKFAFDLRILQSPPIGELSEPFSKQQVGSSAMPFKRNPIHAEKIDSLARLLAQMPRLAWDNAAHSLLERTLDDSANRRILLPESFMIADELLHTTTRLVDGLVVNELAMHRNLQVYGPFAASERVLIAAGKAGADRQVMHERLRLISMSAWESVRRGEANPLPDILARDVELSKYFSRDEIMALLDASHHVGDAPRRARELAKSIRESIHLTEN